VGNATCAPFGPAESVHRLVDMTAVRVGTVGFEHHRSALGIGERAPRLSWRVVLVPWVLYQRFGDTDVLRRQYPSMCAWVDGLTATLGTATLFDKPPFQLGDWLDPAAPPENPAAAATDPILVATAYRARVAQVLSEIAGVLGEGADSAKYAELAESVRQAFHDEYVTPRGRVASDSQTAYAFALEFALLTEPNQRTRAAERLVEAVRMKGHKIATGFLGTPLICDALTTAGASMTRTSCCSKRNARPGSTR